MLGGMIAESLAGTAMAISAAARMALEIDGTPGFEPKIKPVDDITHRRRRWLCFRVKGSASLL